MSYTKGPLSQGRLLITSRTKHWSEEERERANASEQRLILANFHSEDQGQSRIHIAQVENPEDARRMVACWNACKGITTKALEKGVVDHCVNAVLDIWTINSSTTIAASKKEISYMGSKILEATDGE